jgi:hypothetical protein
LIWWRTECSLVVRVSSTLSKYYIYIYIHIKEIIKKKNKTDFSQHSCTYIYISALLVEETIVTILISFVLSNRIHCYLHSLIHMMCTNFFLSQICGIYILIL